jgi:nicotinamide riboside transporter PnuC
MPLPAPVGWLLTMTFVMVGWIIFRAPDLGIATSILASMTGFNGITGALGRPEVLAECLLACIVVPPAHQLMNGFKPYPAIAAVAAIVGAYCVLYVGKGAPAEFIYFQF